MPERAKDPDRRIGIGGRNGFGPGLPLALSAGLIAAALIRVVYLLLYARRIPFYQSPVVDAKIYDQWARAIAGGDWLSRAEGVFYRAPLYPYLLALVDRVFGGPVPWMLILQAGLGLALLALAASVARRAGGDRAALFTFILLALYGPLLASESKLLSTTLGLSLQAALLVQSLRFLERPSRGRGFVCGVLAGLVALVRPQALLFAALIPAALLPEMLSAGSGPAGSGPARIGPDGTRRPGILRAWITRAWTGRAGLARRWLFFWAGCAIVILPVTVRNRAIGHDWVLISSNGGMTFYQGNNEENHSGLLTIIKKFEMFGSATLQRQMETAAAEKEVGHSLKPSETSAFWTHQGLAFITGRPLDWLVLEGRKVYRILTSYEYADNYSWYLERERIWILRLTLIPFGLLLALGLGGAILGAWRGPAGRLAAAAAALGLFGCLTFYVSSRYRMESVVGLAVLGGIGLARIFPGPRGAGSPVRSGARDPEDARVGPRGGGRRPPREWIAVGTAALVFLLSFLPAGAPARSQESITYLQLGNALEMQKRFEEARTAYRQAIDNLPVNVYAWNSLLQLTARLDGPEAADSLLRRVPAVTVADHPLTLYTRGFLQSRLGQDDRAEASFREALSANPLMKEARYALALLLEKNRRYEEALTELEAAQKLAPADPDLLSHLIYVRIQLRRYAEAREACRELLALRPGDTDARLNLGVAGFYLGDLDAAEAEFRDLLARPELKDDPLLLYYHGLVRWRRGDRAGAADDLAKVAAKQPDNRRAAWYLSLARGEPLPAFAERAGAGREPLRSFIRARSGEPWGTPLTPLEEGWLQSLSSSEEGAAIGSEIRRYLAEERSGAVRP